MTSVNRFVMYKGTWSPTSTSCTNRHNFIGSEDSVNTRNQELYGHAVWRHEQFVLSHVWHCRGTSANTGKRARIALQ